MIINILDLFLSPWIRIPNPDLDPDPEDPLNPDPKHWLPLSKSLPYWPLTVGWPYADK